MRHSLHHILMRLLGSEQCAFDATSLEHWPPGAWPQERGDTGWHSIDTPQPSETATRDSE